MKQVFLLALAVAAGCNSGSEPQHGGVASVNVRVLSIDGQPLAGRTVGVSCAGGVISAQLTSDNSGQAGGSLTAPPAVFEESSSIECTLGSPTIDNAHFRTVSTVVFRPFGGPTPIHFVTLQETAQ